MKKFLIVVDMQKDFIDGSLGTKEAQAMVENAAMKIAYFDGEIFVTMDTHDPDYLDTAEGKKLPVKHCIYGTKGWQLDERIQSALAGKRYHLVEKPSFGSTDLPHLLRSVIPHDLPRDQVSIELIGLCTDICVVSNALMLKAHFPEAEFSVDAACCAGVTPESHDAALKTMAMCQIDII